MMVAEEARWRAFCRVWRAIAHADVLIARLGAPRWAVQDVVHEVRYVAEDCIHAEALAYQARGRSP